MGHETPFLTRWFKRAMGIRLTLLLPLMLMTLTVAVGLWTIHLTTGSLGAGRPRSLVDVQAVRRAIFLVTGIGGGLAFLLGLALAYSINRERPLPSGSEAPGQGDQAQHQEQRDG